jgi:hypothetical protein
MTMLSLLLAAGLLTFGAAVSEAKTIGNTKVLTRISDQTGVPVETLQTQKETTGLGYGGLEHANLLANASGQSFETIVAKKQAGEGWGQIAHDYGLNLGKVVSAAHRSSQSTMHTHSSVHGKSSTAFSGRGRTLKGGHGAGSRHGPAQAKAHGHGHAH